MKGFHYLNNLYKFSNSPYSIAWNADRKNGPKGQNRCMAPVASKMYYAGSISRSGQNWKFHNVQTPVFN